MKCPFQSVLALIVLPALAAAQSTVRVSLSDTGLEGHGASWQESISANGRFLAFHSYAYNLVPGDLNAESDIFVRDLVRGRTRVASVNPMGLTGNGGSEHPALSDNGRWLAFFSEADDLVAGDTNGAGDVFVRDLRFGVTVRASVDSSGNQGLGASGAVRGPAISADGRRVAFYSLAPNLVVDDTNDTWDVFVHDLFTGVTRRVSVSSSGQEASNVLVPAAAPSLSADGRYVAFEFSGDTLVPSDTNGRPDVFVHDLETGTTTRVSVGPSGTESQFGAQEPSISATGRYVAFTSTSNDLVPGDGNNGADVFVHDRRTKRNVLASVGNHGEQADFGCRYPVLSRNGRFVAFESLASTLVPGDTNSKTDLFLRDLVQDETIRLNLASDGSQSDRSCYGITMTANAHAFAFWTAASLVDDDTNETLDVFLRRLDGHPTPGPRGR